VKILIIGHARHGKDTFAQLLCEATANRLSFTSSSEAALDAIWPALKLMTGLTDKVSAFASRHLHRDLWKELISLYNAADKSALCKKILKQSDIYVGMRCAEEFAATKNLFDFIFYIKADSRKPQEPSMHIPFDPKTMLLIENNGSTEALRETAQQWADKEFWGVK
jgi:hypothetical protein